MKIVGNARSNAPIASKIVGNMRHITQVVPKNDNVRSITQVASKNGNARSIAPVAPKIVGNARSIAPVASKNVDNVRSIAPVEPIRQVEKHICINRGMLEDAKGHHNL